MRIAPTWQAPHRIWEKSPICGEPPLTRQVPPKMGHFPDAMGTSGEYTSPWEGRRFLEAPLEPGGTSVHSR